MISPDDYKKSSLSETGGCVEVRLLDDGNIGLRDSKDVAKPAHKFTPLEWRAFLAAVRNGEFDL